MEKFARMEIVSLIFQKNFFADARIRRRRYFSAQIRDIKKARSVMLRAFFDFPVTA